MTDDQIEIIEVKRRHSTRDSRTGQYVVQETVDGYLLHRGQEFSGVHLSWDRRREFLCPFTSREAAEQGIEALRTIGEMETAMPSTGPVVRRLFVTVPFDAAYSAADRESLLVEIDADCATVLSAVASALGCSPSEAVGEMLKRVAEAAR